MSTSSDITDRLAAQGYTARRAEILALTTLEQQPDGARVLLLEGPPGAGKTYLAACYAAATGARHVYALLHAWTDDQELFAGVDVVAAVVGDAARVHRPGVLALAAEASRLGPTVVCLDEIDKAPERVEGLLLDVLQTGRVPVRPGVHLEARLDRLIVCLTSNGTRPLGDALLRRCRRVRMTPLPVEEQEQDRIVARAHRRPRGRGDVRGEGRPGGGRGGGQRGALGAGTDAPDPRCLVGCTVDRRRSRISRPARRPHRARGAGGQGSGRSPRRSPVGRGPGTATTRGVVTGSLTLRDLRRLASRRVGTPPRWLYIRRGSLEVPSWTTAEIDAAIARHGSRALLSALLDAAARSTPQGAVGESPTVDETDAHCSTTLLDDTRDKLSPPSDPEGPIEASTDVKSCEANSPSEATASDGESSKTQETHDHACDEASAVPVGSAAEDGNEPRPTEGRAGAPGESSAAGAHEESSADAREAPSRPPEQPSADHQSACPSGSGCATAYGDEDAFPSGESGAGSSPTVGGPSTASCTEGRPVTEVTSALSGARAPMAPDPNDTAAHIESTCVDADVDSDAGHRGAPHGGRHSQHFPRSPRLPTWAPGGDFALAVELLERRIDRGLRGDARAVAGALRQLLRTLDICGDDPSPRLDAGGLVTELVTRRYALARAQRRELAPAVVVLAADCSVSCSAVCDATLTACLAIAREMPHVLVVRHSNGAVIDVSGALAPRFQPREACRLGEIPVLLGCRAAGMVAFGDWDAGHCYERLAASGAPLYWLDSYAARAGEPRPSSARLRAGAAAWRHKPAGWYQGVNDAGRAAYALREMAREMAR